MLQNLYMLLTLCFVLLSDDALQPAPGLPT
jgi:hypothetical protein